MPKTKEEITKVELPQPDYSNEELSYRAYLIKRLEDAKTQREDTYTELNDMTVQEYYDTNFKAANSYIPPKKNPEDTRIVTGTTEEKGSALISAILNYNLEPNIVAFDKNDMEVDELGRNMEDLIKKSREIEEYDSKRRLIYKEAMDQGTVFVEEQWVEETKIEKELGEINWDDGIKIKDIKIKPKEVKGNCYCATRMLRGDKVYLGTMKEFEMKNQPFVFTVDNVPYAQAKAIFGKWERFKYVPKKMSEIVTDDSTIRHWSLNNPVDDYVEIIKYQDKWSNEYMIMINGVMMLPCYFPLTAISPSGEYTIAKGDVYPISQFFALSKSIPAKTKVDQGVLDEMLKLIVLKTRESFRPPLANNTGRVISRRSLESGKIIDQIDPEKLKPIGDPKGVTTAEFNAYQFIKNIVDEKSVSPAFMGETQPGRQTATEILEMKKQQMIKLGLVIYGIMDLERQLAWLRTYNILANWTKEQDTKVNDITGEVESVFKTVVVDTQIEDNQNGKKIIEFSPNANEYSPEQIMEEEDQMSNVMRTPVRKVYINPDIAKMRYFWYITINPTEKGGTDFDMIMLKQHIQDGMTLFGPQALNLPYLMKRYASLSKQDPNKFFIQNAQAMPTEAALGGGDNGGMGAQLNRGISTSMIPQ